MMTRPVYRIWNESCHRAFILLLVLGMLATQLAVTTVYSTFDSLRDSHVCRESSAVDEAGPCDRPLPPCSHGTVSYAPFPDERVPDDETCCPYDCAPCSLACCEGMPLVHAPAATLLNVTPTGSIPCFRVCYLLFAYPADIFHPPRV